MADEHPAILRRGVTEWNEWRNANPEVIPDLHMASLGGRDLRGANLRNANLEWADVLFSDLSGADLRGANLYGVDARNTKLIDAKLQGANLHGTVLLDSDLSGANLTGCAVYGVSAWNVRLDRATQRDLVITRPEEVRITVDDLQVAQFVYLLLNHANLRSVLNSVAERGVLILGRFGGGGLEVLRTIAEALRGHGYLPMIFDFERPSAKNYTETIKTLAGLSRFVIVDLSGPSVPQELSATVPFFKIPFVPIMERGRNPYSMFRDILEFDWVLGPPIVEFTTTDELIEVLPSRVIHPAEKRFEYRKRLLGELFGT